MRMVRSPMFNKTSIRAVPPAVLYFLALALVVLMTGTVGAQTTDNADNADEEEPDKKKAKSPPLPDLDTGYQFEVLWNTSAGRGLARRFGHKLIVTPLKNRLYVSDAYGFVAAINSKTGKIIWETEVLSLEPSAKPKKKHRKTAYLSSGPSAHNDTLFVGTTQAEVIALSIKNGKEQWRTALTSEVLAPPVANDKLVFAQTSDGRLVALTRENGTEVWSFDNPVPRISLRGTATPVLVGDTVITAFASGKIGVLDAENGELLCEQRITIAEGRSELERIIDSDYAPIALDGTIYAGSYQGSIRAFRFANCDILWEYKVGTSSALSEGFSQIYMIDEDDRVIALNKNTGRPAWINEDLLHRKLASPIAYHNYLIVGDKRGQLYVISQSEGKLLAYQRIAKKGIHTTPVVRNKVIYVLDDVGGLTALRVVLKEAENS